MIIAVVLGDYLVESKPLLSRQFWAIFDNGVHFFVACIALLPILILNGIKGFLPYSFACLMASFIDLDHFLFADSFTLNSALNLDVRPPTHSLTFVLLLSGFFMIVKKDKTFGVALFFSLTTHVIRDAAGGFPTLLYWPFPAYRIPHSIYLFFTVMSPSFLYLCRDFWADGEIPLKALKPHNKETSILKGMSVFCYQKLSESGEVKIRAIYGSRFIGIPWEYLQTAIIKNNPLKTEKLTLEQITYEVIRNTLLKTDCEIIKEEIEHHHFFSQTQAYQAINALAFIERLLLLWLQELRTEYNQSNNEKTLASINNAWKKILCTHINRKKIIAQAYSIVEGLHFSLSKETPDSLEIILNYGESTLKAYRKISDLIVKLKLNSNSFEMKTLEESLKKLFEVNFFSEPQFGVLLNEKSAFDSNFSPLLNFSLEKLNELPSKSNMKTRRVSWFWFLIKMILDRDTNWKFRDFIFQKVTKSIDVCIILSFVKMLVFRAPNEVNNRLNKVSIRTYHMGGDLVVFDSVAKDYGSKKGAFPGLETIFFKDLWEKNHYRCKIDQHLTRHIAWKLMEDTNSKERVTAYLDFVKDWIKVKNAKAIEACTEIDQKAETMLKQFDNDFLSSLLSSEDNLLIEKVSNKYYSQLTDKSFYKNERNEMERYLDAHYMHGL